MAKAFINYDFSTVTDDVIAVWYENSAPGAELDRVVMDGVTILKTGSFLADELNPVIHIFKFYASSDGTTLDTQIGADLYIDASLYNEPQVEWLEFTVGSGLDVGDGVHFAPEDGDTEYINDDLDNDDILAYTVEKKGYGTLSWNSNLQINTAGFEYNDGDEFSDGEEYLITIYRNVTFSAPTTAANIYSDIEVISTDETLDSTHFGKIIICEHITPLGILTLPEASTVPNLKRISFNTEGLYRYVRVQLHAGDTIKRKKVDVNYVDLATGEEFEIMMKSGQWYIIKDTSETKVGHRIFTDHTDVINTLPADGTEYQIADYPRLYEALKTAQKVTYTQYNSSTNILVGSALKTKYPYKGFFAVDTGAGTFKVPDMRNMSVRTLKYFDGTSDSTRLSQGGGGFQSEEIIEHNHELPPLANSNSLGVSRVYPRGGGINAAVLFTEEAGGPEQRVDSISQFCLILF